MVVAEFDEEGFSAVASFFGKEKDKGTASDPSNYKSNASNQRGRLGLGATVPTKSGNSGRLALDDESEKKKFLSVGKKRSRHDGDDGLGSDGENVDVSSDDDDEGEGRTSAARPKKKHSSAAVSAPAQIPKKKKKKKGKKERAAAADAAAASTSEETPSKMESQENEHPKEDETGATEQEGNAKKTKRKRPKVRSRQKNIRKDHRIASERPEHLKFGKQSYTGRPLTAETREVLGIKETRSSQRDHWNQQIHSGGADAGEEGLGLAIDELLGEPVDENNTGPDQTEKESDADPVLDDEKLSADNDLEDVKPKKEKKKQKKTRKKSKYRNIA